MSYADTTGFDRDQNFVWQRSCPMHILQVLREASGCLASALNCKSSGLRFKSWTLQGEELVFGFFKSALVKICQCLPSQRLCKSVNVFQANTCANLSVFQCLPSQHLCKSVSVSQANTCANLSVSPKPTLVQMCQHLPSQHLCKCVSVLQANTCANISVSASPSYALCTLKTLHRLTHSKHRDKLPLGIAQTQHFQPEH